MAPNPPAVTSRNLTAETEAEQIDRQNELEASNNGEDQLDTETGFVQPENDDQGGAEPEPQRREPTVRMSPQDAKREAMINRFRRDDVDPFDGDLTRPENLYGRAAQENLTPDADTDDNAVVGGEQQETQEEIDAELAELTGQQPAQRQQQQPAKRSIGKVRGQEVFMTDDEILEAARKTKAADTYLEDARAILESAKQIRAERSQPGQHPPAGQDGAQDYGQDPDPSTTRQPPADDVDLKSVVEKIQFGDPEEAAQALEQAIERRAQRQVTEGNVNRLVTNDLARSQADLKKFRADNAELDKDPIASRTIEGLIYDVYREEIKALGVDESQIPTDNKTLADWHRLYRVHGHEVSKTSEVLNKAKDRYLSWRGDQPETKPAPRKGAPAIKVDVDRTERRMNMPQQPTRSVSPRPNQQRPQAKTVEQSRQDAVTDMRRARGQLTG